MDEEEAKEEVKGLPIPMPMKSNPIWRPKQEDPLTPKRAKIFSSKRQAQSHKSQADLAEQEKSEGSENVKGKINLSRRADSQVLRMA